MPARNYTVESIVGPKQITPGGCANQAGGKLRGGPLITDRWSTWMEAYYGSRDDIGAMRRVSDTRASSRAQPNLSLIHI